MSFKDDPFAQFLEMFMMELKRSRLFHEASDFHAGACYAADRIAEVYMKYNEEKLYKPVFDIDPQIYKRGG
jgi:hypothetical protein